ncbi:hypothetical protein CLV30_11346 [Haloactinopolyspora alba]|uniref:Uncharacterized protein n=1 Tax=Haloactinopolyspora alba TaxID=648780 RepID=A0A2P8DWG9_9ACTN|nr:hypothetical protein [Haloactinopolyspora alba]PSL01558.1 hypothetical protein CLV30_11346 [Haloactinopolyspora alba]
MSEQEHEQSQAEALQDVLGEPRTAKSSDGHPMNDYGRAIDQPGARLHGPDGENVRDQGVFSNMGRHKRQESTDDDTAA